MIDLTGKPGFALRPAKVLTKRRVLALELIATVTLTVSLVVAATAVSLGNRSFARSDLAGRAALQAASGMSLEPIGDW